MEKYKCVCGKTFTNSQSFNGHKSHCKEHQLKKYDNLDLLIDADNMRHTNAKDTFKIKVEENNKNKLNEKNLIIQKWISEQHTCEKCGKVMTEYYGSGRFCSKFCANSRKHTEETKKKISDSLCSKNSREIYYENPKRCIVCNNIIEYEHLRRKTCSKRCRCLAKYPQKYDKSIYSLYRKQCAFLFKLYDYCDELDLNLINIYGMYKVSSDSNRDKDNLDGVSRDHMYSILDGYINKVDPYLLSHPANCRIIKQTDNASKHSNSCISLYELVERVKDFNIKYGYYKNNIDYFKLEEFKKFD